jgi:hypothetical protein
MLYESQIHTDLIVLFKLTLRRVDVYEVAQSYFSFTIGAMQVT